MKTVIVNFMTLIMDKISWNKSSQPTRQSICLLLGWRIKQTVNRYTALTTWGKLPKTIQKELLKLGITK